MSELEERRAEASNLEHRLFIAERERDTLRAALERGPSWNEWIAWLDQWYPADVAYFAESDDPGPRAVRAFRAALIGGPT